MSHRPGNKDCPLHPDGPKIISFDKPECTCKQTAADGSERGWMELTEELRERCQQLEAELEQVKAENQRIKKQNLADAIFINHIQLHLSDGDRVICKICGETAEDIIYGKEQQRCE